MESTATRHRWLVAIIGAIVVLALLLPLFRTTDLVPIRVPVPEPSLAIADARASDPGLREATQMHDLAPLFIPTEYNAKLREVPRPEPGRGVLDVEPTKMSFPEAGLQLEKALPAVVTMNGKPISAVTPTDALLTTAIGPSLSGFGRREGRLVALPARGGFLEVVAAGTGERVLAEVLPSEAAPKAQTNWHPPQYLAVLDASGLIGPLRVTEGSRVEEVDRHFQDYLVRTFRLGERLPPGFYRVTVGP